MTYERIKELLRKGEKLSIVYKRYLNKAENDEFFSRWVVSGCP